MVEGNDILPDMYIGRLPVKTATEAQAVVNKIINYELNPPTGTLNQKVLFIADNPDSAGDFHSLSMPSLMTPPTSRSHTSRTRRRSTGARRRTPIWQPRNPASSRQ